MIKFDKPKNLNGAELRDELRSAGVVISDDIEAVVVDGSGNLLLDISESDAAKAEVFVKKHNGTTTAPELSIEDKLASVGLNLNDLKAALGIA